MIGDKSTIPLFYLVSKSVEHIIPFVQPLVEDEEIDEDDLPLRWSV